jgi:hypothetical protein
MVVKSFRDLLVWQKGMQTSRAIYELSARFPKNELYALTNQMQRAAISIPANIAEGHARESTKIIFTSSFYRPRLFGRTPNFFRIGCAVEILSTSRNHANSATMR